MPNLDHETIELAFIVVTGTAVLLQTIILLAIFLAVKKAAKSLKEQVEDVRSSVMPVIYNTRDLFTRVAPKLEQTVNDLSGLASTLRTQTAEVESTATEILERIRHQTTRVDTMVSSVLNSVDRASEFVTEAVNKPVRQISGLLASIKAIIESLRHSEAAARANHYNDDQETFI